MRKDFFIVLEGPDGSGQTTQAQLLGEYFKSRGKEVFLTKEPTLFTAAGKKIRDVLEGKEQISGEELQKLFVEDRNRHLKDFILPALQTGKIVISDRYFFSTLAYGSLACDFNWLMDLNKDFPLSDFTFILKVRPEECLRRIERRGTKFELFEKKKKLEKIMENYLKLAQIFQNVYVLDGEKSISEIHQEIRGYFEKSNSLA